MLAVATAAGAATPAPEWGPGTEIAQPSDAVPANAAQLQAISCTSPGNCVAVGGYQTSSGSGGLAATETDGTWASASAISPPSGASGEQLEGVSCTSTGNCVAVGQAVVAGAYEPIRVNETAGSWGTATQIALPADAQTNGTYMDNATAVSCTSAGNCVAVGDYATASASQSPFVAQESGGSWQAAQSLTLPADAIGGAALGVACSAPGSCALAGSYQDYAGDYLPIVAQESGGSWGQASAIGLPASPSPTASTQSSFLQGISCTSPGNCVADGSYFADPGDYGVPIVAGETNGSWGTAQAISQPAGAASTLGSFNALTGLACPAAGECIAVGYYDDSSGAGQPLVALESGGSWGAASAGTLPAGSAEPPSGSGALAAGVACTSAVNCTYVGGYFDSSGHMQLFATASYGPLAIATATLAGAAVGRPYMQQLAASGGAGSYSWRVLSGSLPRGLRLAAATGKIVGTPRAGGNASFTVAVSAAGPPSQSQSETLAIDVAGPRIIDARLRHGRLIVTLACEAPGGAACRGSLALSFLPRHRRAPALARRRYRVGAGATRTIVLALGPGARQLLAGQHREVTLLIRAAGAARAVPAWRLRI